MALHSEIPATTRPRWRQVVADFGPGYAANGFIGWLFAATGPVAIILSVATSAKLSATEYAVVLAKTFSATVKAIYVDTGMDALEYPEEAMTEDVYEGVHPSIKGLALAQAICERNGVGCEVEVIHGGIAKRIVAVAEEWNADVIVLGDTGRTGLKRIALGSVAETVVKGSPIPVLVIKG